jgi:DNA-binding MarR family transcriptional regulator/GNAT superfamily N-acetyltransferase
MDAVETVRRFNRFYTQRVGALREGLLDSPFTLTEVRVLYELSHRQRATAAELGRDLGLDRGYLSRILTQFEREGFLERVRSETDARQVLLTITPEGRAAFEPLDARQNEEVSALLEELSISQQRRLVEAMGTIESLLGARSSGSSSYVLRPHQPGDIGWIVHRHGTLYWQEYRYDESFEALVAQIGSDFLTRFDPKKERCWIAERDGEIIGSVFLVKDTDVNAKLRLLYVEPSARGLGIGRRLVDECVRFARERGYRKITLWTQSELEAAGRIYKAAGFEIVDEKPTPNFGRNDLVAQIQELTL